MIATALERKGQRTSKVIVVLGEETGERRPEVTPRQFGHEVRGGGQIAGWQALQLIEGNEPVKRTCAPAARLNDEAPVAFGQPDALNRFKTRYGLLAQWRLQEVLVPEPTVSRPALPGAGDFVNDQRDARVPDHASSPPL